MDIDNIELHADGTVTFTIVDPTAPPTRLTATTTGDGTLATDTVTWLQAAFGIPADTSFATATHRPGKTPLSLA